jgi:hypothetical protein
MCPLCVGSALLALTGATSAGGLALVGARALGLGTGRKTPEQPDGPVDPGAPTEITAAGNPAQLQ